MKFGSTIRSSLVKTIRSLADDYWWPELKGARIDVIDEPSRVIVDVRIRKGSFDRFYEVDSDNVAGDGDEDSGSFVRFMNAVKHDVWVHEKGGLVVGVVGKWRKWGRAA